MNPKRPINLDLASLKFPPMAIASILHRISGVLLFLLMPFILYLFDRSLQSATSFEAALASCRQPMGQLLLWMFSSAWVYHFFAGIRHMVMDAGYGEDLAIGRLSAVIIIGLGVIATIGLGIKIWLGV